MPIQPRNDSLLDKWRETTAREKTEVIAAFLDEYGEQANWDDWRNFLHMRQMKGFEWINTVD